ncbi:DNA fragmentation factor subunit alpha [Hemiscyllium ocellatum]|uniref:DNA fragmentation factor subunit alpha n=1 Tax=Hemiscyllium ocellatum TaxID=170820 RepID=UPI0029673A32|nr:DNA fragmentation factor subunit alpha [Hemiscyllium ocellatum]
MDPGRRRFLCKICDSSRLQTFGVAVKSLQDLVAKGKEKLCLGKSDAQQTFTVVLEDDGTVVDDEDYFKYLPENTKFMILDSSQEWTPANVEFKNNSAIRMNDDIDGVGSVDSVDYPEQSSDWRVLAKQLRQNLARIITMSESDLQTLIDVPSAELAKELGETLKGTEAIQDSLQRALDNREEQREAKEILKLYRKAFQTENEDSEPAKETVEVDGSNLTASETFWRNKHTIEVLRQKPSPELSLSNQELQEILKRTEEDLSSTLNCSIEEVRCLRQDCRKEFERRMDKVKSLEELRQYSTK